MVVVLWNGGGEERMEGYSLRYDDDDDHHHERNKGNVNPSTPPYPTLPYPTRLYYPYQGNLLPAPNCLPTNSAAPSPAHRIATVTACHHDMFA